MSVTINGTSGLVFNDASTQNTAAKTGMVNRIINGAMMIDQRNAGASVTPTDGQFSVDRWKASLNVASKFSLQQSTTAPAGFINSILATSLSAYSVGAGEVTGILQQIEGFNTADFAWGTAGAQTVTVSFWVRSSLTGTFGGSLRNSAANRSYPFSYTISAANTFEQKTITIAGDTSGTWLTNNGVGVQIYFSLGSGSTFSSTAGAWAAGNFVSATGATSVVGTNGATFYITGVQLEKGSTATSFDYRPYGTELALCQRYYYRETNPAAFGHMATLGTAVTAAIVRAGLVFPVTTRTAPTGIEYANLAVDDGAALINSSTVTLFGADTARATLNFNASGYTQFRPYQPCVTSSANGYVGFTGMEL